MEELILYTYTFRSRAERVLWALREFGLPHKVIRLDPFKGEALTPQFLKLNPAAKVPVLIHGDAVLTESLAIMEYLNDLSAQIKLIPTVNPALYQYKKMIYYAATEIEPYLWISWQATGLKKIYRWPEGTSDECFKRVERALPSVYKALEDSAYIAGDEFTLADIYYNHLLTWAQASGSKLPVQAITYLSNLSKRAHFPEEMRQS